MRSWPRPVTSGAARSARTIAVAGSRTACARNRIIRGTGHGICGRARWLAAVPGAGSCRCRRWTRCAASWRTISASPTCRRTSWPSTRRSARPARQAWTSPRRPRPRRGTKKGLYDQVAAEFAAEVDRLAELATRSLGSPGEGLAAMELAIRTAMTQLGASLLGRLLAADTGHRGPRIDCRAGHCTGFVGYRSKTIQTVLGSVELRRAYYHCRVCRRGVVPATTSSASPVYRCHRGCAGSPRAPPRPSRSPPPPTCSPSWPESSCPPSGSNAPPRPTARQPRDASPPNPQRSCAPV